MRLIKGLAFCLVTAIPLVTLAACSSSGSGTPAGAPPEVSSITISVTPTSDAAGIYIAADRGFFAQQGLNVKIATNESVNVAIGALQTGAAQLVQGSYATVIQDQIAGRYDGKPINMRIVANSAQMGPGNQGLYAMPGARYDSVQQLVKAHAKVGVPLADSDGTVLIGSLLAADGYTNRDLHEVAMEPTQLPVALAKGAIAAAYLPEPLAAFSEQLVGAVKLADLDQGPLQNWPIGTIVGSTSWVQSHPNTVAAFQRGLSEGQQVADTDRDAVQTALEKHTPGMTPLVASGVAVDTYPLSMNVSVMQTVPDAMYQYGIISKPFQISSMIQQEPGATSG
jgi:NitT/TauT family transport system substrate-binding protein